jgi:putative Ig domain-containing protein/ASPM-SPD-2-Hydin domain-containing protein
MHKLAGAVAAAVALALCGAAPAFASHGGGGSGGGTPAPAPTPTGTPAVSISPSTVDFGTEALGTTSAPRTITITDTGTAPVFFNGTPQSGLDFNRTSDDCVGIQIAAGASCTMTVVFQPTVTGPRSSTITLIDTAGTQTLSFTGTGTSTAGPTPFTIDTSFDTCANGGCALESTPIVNNFVDEGFVGAGQFTAPLTWAVIEGALPPGTSLSPAGILTGNPSSVGTSTFTLRATDAAGRTATQSFSQTVRPVPAAGDPRCQHAPSEASALTATGAIGGVRPSGTAPIDVSHFTACGGYYVINASVKDVNLPNGTVLWVTLSQGGIIGTITLNNGQGSIRPFVYDNELRKQEVQVFASPPFGALAQPILIGSQLI